MGLSLDINAEADEWSVTNDNQMKTKVKVEDGQYTFEEGDTFWAIGQAINIQPLKLIEWLYSWNSVHYSDWNSELLGR